MRSLTRAVAVLAALLLPASGGAATPELALSDAPAGRPGGRLVVALRAAPRTLNPVVAVDNPSLTVLHRLTGDLVHVDRVTQATEPALAKRWRVSEDGRRYRVELRRGLRFSDGHPLTAEDVVFTFRVYTDPAVASPHRDLLVVAGEPVAARAVDEHTVELELAAPYAVGERLFDSIAVLPRHLLEAAWREGRLADAWGLSTPPSEIAGLGPFRLTRVVPGERIELERNPHYWKVDAAGARLPYLDELHFLLVADAEAQAVLFRAGTTHLVDGLSPDAFALLERDAGERPYVLADLGPSLLVQMLFFNLNDLRGRDLPAVAARQEWFRRRAFREAVSRAVDREAIARLVYRGRATPAASDVTAANRLWRNETLRVPERSLDAAAGLLAEAGFRREGDGPLRDERGREVAFTVVTNASNAERVQIATLLQEDLRQLGIALRVVPLEFQALLARIFDTHDYDAVILGLGGGDVDPNAAMNVWAAGGSHHLFRLTGEPAAWETEIDALLRRQLTTLDRAERKRLYDRVQEIAARELPFVLLVSPNVLVGAHSGLGNVRPAVLDHPTLWNVDELYWRSPPAGG